MSQERAPKSTGAILYFLRLIARPLQHVAHVDPAHRRSCFCLLSAVIRLHEFHLQYLPRSSCSSLCMVREKQSTRKSFSLGLQDT